ncbi:glycosyltransferase [uncultured Bifidobacterium sp.]|uniref:glycosyltransferase family 2 protein n=1 Tax=uncultured Bifidobacterium sp. TaxID=165187 RepID=UPI002613AF14|nr:glycosyltransferase [uncultured Bifidobacterium sp.]
MMDLFNDRTYRIAVEAVEASGPDGNGAVTVVGWAVDKFRHVPMTVRVDQCDGASVVRTSRPDMNAVFSLNDEDAVGFRISVPQSVTEFMLTCETPGRTITRAIDVAALGRRLRRSKRHHTERRIVHYLSHSFTPRGAMAIMGAVRRRVFKDGAAYRKWIAQNETMTRSDAMSAMSQWGDSPLISLVVPVFNVDERWLRRCVQSIRDQWYANWELCLADDKSSAEHIRPLLQELANTDSRIKIVFRDDNGGISAATNSAIDLATGSYIGFMDNDDELAPQALYEIVQSLNSRPEADFIYTDEDKITEKGTRFDPFFKPGFSPHLLLGHNYITHFVVVTRALLDAVGPLRSEFDGSQDYDFVLRATEKAREVRHIPSVLYHWRTLPTSVAGDPRSKMYAYEAGKRAIEEALARRSLPGAVTMLHNLGTYRIDYEMALPRIAVVLSSYSASQIAELKSLTKYDGARYIPVSDSSSINDVVASCDEEYVVLLSGVMPQDSSWLRNMVNYCADPSVSVVGGKIYDAQSRVLNVGITLRALRSGNPFEMRGLWDEGIGYYFRDLLPREMFGVTDDCMLVRKRDFTSSGGVDYSLEEGLRGVDLCVRIHSAPIAGCVLWQPYSEFTSVKPKPLDISPDSCMRYLQMHVGLEDRYSPAFFPFDKKFQRGVEFSVDEVLVSSDSTEMTVRGWAADLHGNADVHIALEDMPGASLKKVDRYLRPDVNSVLPVPQESMLGFRAEIAVPDGKATLRHVRSTRLVFSTPTDSRKIDVNIPASTMSRFVKLMRTALRMIRHPRTTARIIRDKYVTPREQRAAYHRLIQVTESYDLEAVQKSIRGFSHKPLISIVMPVYNVDPQWLSKCIDSVLAQSYENWQLCIADDHSTRQDVRPVLERYAQLDNRITVVFREKNGHISRATNSALAVAAGDYVALMDNDDEIAPHALFEVAKTIDEHPDVDLIYTDEDKIDEKGVRSDPHFKPNFSPDLLLSTNYISHLGVYRRSLVESIGGFRAGYEGSQDYDFVLRFMERTDASHVRHIPKVLYHWRTLPTSTASDGGAKNYASLAGLRALQDAVARRGYHAEVLPGIAAGIYDIHYDVDENELVSIIIPTRDGYDNIERCVTSIIEKTNYGNYEIVIADNGSTNPHMADLYERFRRLLGSRFHVEEIDIPFNYSRINNIAAEKADGRYLLFLNDDTEIINPEWMTRMVSFAQHERIGVVGAKLYYPIDTIQHAGIVLGLGGVAGHIQAGFPRSYFGYYGRLIENVNYSAVTAACCMIRSDDFHAVGGFDEALAVAYNDVDLCMRIHDQLHRDILWSHETELYHYESMTRGYDTKDEKRRKRLKGESDVFLRRYREQVANDPYYNPNLSRSSGNYWVRQV